MKKRIIVIIIAVALVLALIPFRVLSIKDGGSVEYKAALYSVTNVHRSVAQLDAQQIEGFEVGWRVEILGVTVYEKTVFEKATADVKGELEIRHDREPIDNHFPGFPETKELSWIAYSLYDDRSPGPTIYGMEILATLEKDELDRFLGDTELSPVDKWPEVIEETRLLPSSLTSTDNWQQVMDVRAILPAKELEDIHASVILVNKEDGTLCVYGTGGN